MRVGCLSALRPEAPHPWRLPLLCVESTGDMRSACAGRSRPAARAAQPVCGRKGFPSTRRVGRTQRMICNRSISRRAASHRQRNCSESRAMREASAQRRKLLRPPRPRGSAAQAGPQAAERSAGRRSEQIQPRQPRLTAPRATRGALHRHRRMRRRRGAMCRGRHANAIMRQLCSITSWTESRALNWFRGRATREV